LEPGGHWPRSRGAGRWPAGPARGIGSASRSLDGKTRKRGDGAARLHAPIRMQWSSG